MGKGLWKDVTPNPGKMKDICISLILMEAGVQILFLLKVNGP